MTNEPDGDGGCTLAGGYCVTVAAGSIHTMVYGHAAAVTWRLPVDTDH